MRDVHVLEVQTAMPLLRLIELSPGDAGAYLSVVQASLDHLTRYGDYNDMRTETRESIVAELGESANGSLRMGVWLDAVLIGRVDLIPKEPGKWVIGYWLGAAFTGRGYATAACRALIGHARAPHAIEEVYAGVTKGNSASEALLRRLGFRFVADMGAYNRFRLTLAETAESFPGVETPG